jgi:plasmid stability protein
VLAGCCRASMEAEVKNILAQTLDNPAREQSTAAAYVLKYPTVPPYRSPLARHSGIGRNLENKGMERFMFANMLSDPNASPA